MSPADPPNDEPNKPPADTGARGPADDSIEPTPAAPRAQSSPSKADNPRRWYSWFSALEPSQKIELLSTVTVGISTVFATMIALMAWLSPEGRERLEIEQRAWLGATISLQQPFSLKDDFTFHVDVTNTGKTPALNARVAVESYWSYHFPFPQGAEILLPDEIDGRGSVAPGNSLRVVGVERPTRVAVDRLRGDNPTGTLHYYIVGRIDYHDVFGNARTTKFCAYMKTDEPGPIMLVSPQGNDMN